MRRTVFRKKQVFLFLFAFFIFTTPAVTSAEIGNKKITLEPMYPTAGDQVQVELKAHSIDFDTALVTWRINNEVVEHGYSLQSISLTAGPVGTKYTISVSAEDASGEQVYLEKSFTVSDLSFVWEGRTYTPAFYNGSALLSEGAEVAVQAIASVTDSYGGLYKPHELSYSWFIGGSNSASVIGKGKHSIVIKNERPREPLSVYVKVKDPSGTVRAEKKIYIPVHTTKTVLYENNPYVGIRYDNALGDVLGVYDREVAVIAEPYYMSATTRRDSVLKYEWMVAGKEYSSPGGLSFGAENDASGSTRLNVSIKNKDYWLQSSRADLTVTYGERNTWAIQSSNTEPL